MSIILDENGEWTGRCKQLDCIHCLENCLPQLLEEWQITYQCTLDKVEITKDKECAEYRNKMENIIDDLVEELKNRGATGVAILEVDLDKGETKVSHNIKKGDKK